MLVLPYYSDLSNANLDNFLKYLYSYVLTYFKLYCTICRSIKQIELLNLLHLHTRAKKNIATSKVKKI